MTSFNLKKIFIFYFIFLINLNFIYSSKYSNIDTLLEKEHLMTEEESKPKFNFSNGDLEGSFGAKIYGEYFFYQNAYLLNHENPDEEGFFRNKVDLILDLAYGQKRLKHKAVQVYLDLFAKDTWGYIGAYKNSSIAQVKVGDTLLGEHNHKLGRNFLWFKELWLQFSFNAALNLSNKNLHFFKIGWFPFSLGNRIALDSSYGVTYEDDWLYSYPTDYSVPGMNINGTLINDRLFYDLYYAKYRDQSYLFSDVNNNIKINYADKELTERHPWRGVGKDDELWAARLQWLALKGNKTGELKFEPYIYYNEYSDRTVDYANECKSRLGAIGLAAWYQKGNFECTGELISNYGDEHFAAIDTNQALIQVKDFSNSLIPDMDVDDLGMLWQYYDKVVFAADHNKSAPVTTYSRRAARKNIFLTPGIPYPEEGHNESYLTNAEERVRPAYRNLLRGYFGMLAFAYNCKTLNIKFGLEGGYASGDFDPTLNHTDKTYHGFFGRKECFSGKYVNAVMFLYDRETTRPYSFGPGQTEASRAVSYLLTDLDYLGLSADWKPVRFKKRNFNVKPSFVFYWKNCPSYKFDRSTGYPSTTQKARKFLGFEANLFSSIELIKDLSCNLEFAIFFPGGFYKDSRGADVKDVFSMDDPINPGGMTDVDHRLWSDRVIYSYLGLLYKF